MIVDSRNLFLHENFYYNRLQDLLPFALDTKTPDELLYGRAGYLFALLFVKKELGGNIVSDTVISKVVAAILRSGRKLAESRRLGPPLLYEWHGSMYLGAAHGMAGILYILLQAADYVDGAHMETLIRPSVDWLLEQETSGGNLPSSLGHSDRLVQWCHGSPGLVQLCCLASQVLDEPRYLQAALRCGELVWNRGLARKGYSLCHGVAGNAYTFLQLYQTTGEAKHLYRACRFAEWCMEEREGTQQLSPDAPGSLFEGLAGRLYLLSDLRFPLAARFPAYSL